ncbi:MAG: prolyl oligopeptidase family serine peptidase [Fimbriiglobus sp.]
MRMWVIGLVFVGGLSVFADGPGDNAIEKVRPIPPVGQTVPAELRETLQKSLEELNKEIEALREFHKARPYYLELLPDIEIYAKAVRYGLQHNEMYISDKPKRDDAKVSLDLLKRGLERAKELREMKPTWLTATGLVVRGYKSKIDGSVQPYGLVVPESFSPKSGLNYRVDFWWHGRGELLNEIDFIRQRQTTVGEFAPRNAFVVHPYGRYCNANKFAGEIDTLEILDHMKKNYPIDENRLVARGFSMGGAACWQFAAHYPTLWAAAAPGAGFCETPEFLNVFQNEKLEPKWYERKLWHLYNASDVPGNFVNIPTVAYSGELDKQKQAADVMARQMKTQGLDLTHVIGAKAGHNYTNDAKRIINEKIDAIVARGKVSVPATIGFETYSLRYNKCAWVEILGLEKHWERAYVLAQLSPNGEISIDTKNITALRLNFGPGEWTVPRFNININPPTLLESIPKDKLPKLNTDRSFTMTLGQVPEGLAKVPGLQGPIDDAFMDRFIMVKPTSEPMNAKLGAWTQAEMTRAIDQWRKQFRGDAMVKSDKEITDEDIANSNLVLWGDPKSNAILAKIADKLPLKEFSDTKTTILIYPNPLNPKKYVVLNSGFTFREYDQLNNARQVPKLPDYAVIDITTPPNARSPGKVTRAGFFDERWQLTATDGRPQE